MTVYFVECSRCHRMVRVISDPPLDEVERRTFTCATCEKEIKGK